MLVAARRGLEMPSMGPRASSLPIDEALPEVQAALQSHGAAVLVAPPGSGKTTRVPPALLDAGLAGDGQIWMLEPRRVAARSAAGFMARARGERLGESVGYHVRFDRNASAATRLLVVTEGLLTRRLLSDPFLEEVSIVVLDEFHERSRHADLALALLAEVRRDVRQDLRVLVMSATMDPEPVARFLGDAPIVTSDGRAHPVTKHFERAQSDLIEAEVARVLRARWSQSDGDALVFLPGVGEISRCREQLASWAAAEGVQVLPLHGELPPAEQDRALRRSAGRRVILATNVAETSVTVEGVRWVIDSGLVRRLVHDPWRGVDRLELGRVSQASADQRAGRAGREAPGQAVRLWTKAQHGALDAYETPELMRTDLSDVLLDLAGWGAADPRAFGWFEVPPEAALDRARERLVEAGVLPRKPGPPTILGQRIAALGLGVREGRVAAEAWARGYPDVGAALVALLGERDPLRRGLGLDALPTGPCDLLLRLDLLAGRSDLIPDGRRRRLRDQARRIETRITKAWGHAPKAARGSDGDEVARRAILAAFPDRVARRRGEGRSDARMRGGRGVELARECVVRDHEFFVAVDLAEGVRRDRGLVRMACGIESAWLEDLDGVEVTTITATDYDVEADRVTAFRCLVFDDLVLSKRPDSKPDPNAVQACLEQALSTHEERFLARVPDKIRDLQARWACLREWRPELEFPSLEDADLLAWFASYLPGKRRLGDLLGEGLEAMLKAPLNAEQRRALADEAPAVLELPSGRRARIRYEPGRPPILSARVQHLFGQVETPRLGGGKIPCLVELLAPNQRPVQLTQDLGSFWRTTYAQVRKDLRGRYPKHDWPEVPPGL